MDLQHLRQATRQEHEATEAAMPVFGPGLTLAAYGKVLCCLFPVLRSWEAWCAGHAPARLEPLLEGRQRSPWIEADLRILSIPCPALSLSGSQDSDVSLRTFPIDPVATMNTINTTQGADTLPPLSWMDVVLEPGESPEVVSAGEFEAGFLGALYVLEGSTLGGRILARQVEVALDLRSGEGNAYFQGHGAETGAKWREVTTELAEVPEPMSERLIRSAKRTFEVFGKALEGCHVRDPDMDSSPDPDPDANLESDRDSVSAPMLAPVRQGGKREHKA